MGISSPKSDVGKYYSAAATAADNEGSIVFLAYIISNI